MEEKKVACVCNCFFILQCCCLSKLISRVTFLHHLRHKQVDEREGYKETSQAGLPLLLSNHIQYNTLCVCLEDLVVSWCHFLRRILFSFFKSQGKLKVLNAHIQKRIVTFIWEKKIEASFRMAGLFLLGGASLFFCAIFLNREKVSCEEKNKRKMGQLFSQIGQQWKKVGHSTNALKFYGKFTAM